MQRTIHTKYLKSIGKLKFYDYERSPLNGRKWVLIKGLLIIKPFDIIIIIINKVFLYFCHQRYSFSILAIYANFENLKLRYPTWYSFFLIFSPVVNTFLPFSTSIRGVGEIPNFPLPNPFPSLLLLPPLHPSPLPSYRGEDKAEYLKGILVQYKEQSLLFVYKQNKTKQTFVKC